MQDVWVEPGKVSSQIEQVVKYESEEFDTVTVIVLLQLQQAVTA